MRRLVACLVLCLALAVPAAAQQQGRITVVAPQAAALRGSQAAAPSRSVAEAEAEATAPVLPLDFTPVGTQAADARQCRMTCSRDYYFCLAGEDELCPQHWSRCVTRCGS